MAKFRVDLEVAFKKKVVETLEKTVKAVAIIVDSELVARTPVDTGRARSNWLPSLNVSETSTVEPGQKPNVGIVLGSYKINDTILITNNLPYIKRLNDGSSKQAPANFVEAAVEFGANTIK